MSDSLVRSAKWIAIALILSLLTPAAPFPLPHPATAQQNDADWFVYLLLTHSIEPTDLPTLVRVDEHGNAHIYATPFPTNSHFMGFSPDGQYVAYCEPSDTATQMVMWDIEAEQPLWSRNFGSSSACVVSQWAFNPSGNQVVVGIGSDNAHAGDGPHWRIVVLNASNGDITSELNDQMHSPLVMGLDVFGNVALLPYILRFGYDELIFVLSSSVMDSGKLQAYRWSWRDDTIQTAEYWGLGVCDFLVATNELLFTDFEGQEAVSNSLPFGNSLKIVDSNGVRTLYQEPDVSILAARFVNDGRAILVYGMDSNATNYLILISRDGTTRHLPADGYIEPPMTAPGGFVINKPMFFDPDSPYVTQLELHRGNEVSVLWQLKRDPSVETELAILVFSRPTPTDPNLAPFPEIPLP